MGYFRSSIGKKQMMAISGLAMVLFLFAHLSGNMLVFMGPQAINDYSDFLHHLGHGAALWATRIGLLAAVVIHFITVVQLVIENRRARQVAYDAPLHADTRSFATKSMRVTGMIILVYIGWHLYDYTLTPHTMDNSVVDGVYLGLYGHLYNSFLNPARVIGYVIAMIALGLHLSHSIQSVFQTFGFNHPVYTPKIKKASLLIGVVLAIGFSSVPLYVQYVHHFCG